MQPSGSGHAFEEQMKEQKMQMEWRDVQNKLVYQKEQLRKVLQQVADERHESEKESQKKESQQQPMQEHEADAGEAEGSSDEQGWSVVRRGRRGAAQDRCKVLQSTLAIGRQPKMAPAKMSPRAKVARPDEKRDAVAPAEPARSAVLWWRSSASQTSPLVAREPRRVEFHRQPRDEQQPCASSSGTSSEGPTAAKAAPVVVEPSSERTKPACTLPLEAEQRAKQEAELMQPQQPVSHALALESQEGATGVTGGDKSTPPWTPWNLQWNLVVRGTLGGNIAALSDREQKSGPERAAVQEAERKPTEKTPQPVKTLSEGGEEMRGAASHSGAAGHQSQEHQSQECGVVIKAEPSDEIAREVVETRGADARPEQGTVVRDELTLRANYFRLGCNEQWVIFQYEVDVVPIYVSNDSSLLGQLLSTQADILGMYVFYGTQLFLRKQLWEEEVVRLVRHPNTSMLHRLRIRFLRSFNMSTEPARFVSCLMLRFAMPHMEIHKQECHFYDPSDMIRLEQQRLELYPGYVTSIRQHALDVLMRVEPTVRVIRTETCYQMLEKLKEDPINFHNKARRSFIGHAVMSVYNGKLYTVLDIAFDRTPLSTIQMGNGVVTTYRDYYSNVWHCATAIDLNQPLLLARVRDTNYAELYLVPELCRLEGVSTDMRQNRPLLKLIADRMFLTPDRHIRRLEKFVERLQRSPFGQWHAKLDGCLLEVPARSLPPERIYFDVNGAGVPAVPRIWWHAVRKNRMHRVPPPLDNWVVVVSRHDRHLLPSFLRVLRAYAHSIGFQMRQPMTVQTDSVLVSSLAEALEGVFQRDPQLIMFVVPQEGRDWYRVAKKLCCVDRAIPTQQVHACKLKPRHGKRRQQRFVATKVGMQMGYKLGGIPWLVSNPLQSVMVIGIDECNDTTNANLSYVALVATMYSNGRPAPQNYSCIEARIRRGQLKNFIARGVVKAIFAYEREYGREATPRYIFLYRHGIDEDESEDVVRQEVAIIQGCLKKLYVGETPKLTVFVVDKRNGTRLFLGRGNAPHRTIVDDVITLPDRNTFYVVPYVSKTDTATPTAYHIVHDDSGLQMNQLQDYTIKQMYLYYNCFTPINYPAVCQYAYNLAALAAEHLHQLPHENMHNSLSWL